jgi:predicted negative regulator of RcsB-dependent stress response
MEAFFLRDYQLASEALEEALTSVGLPKQPELGVLARELLGGALMALGSYQQALKSFEAIPEEQRRTSVKEALFYLNEKLC